MKGTMSSIEQVILLVAALALCMMLLSLVFNLWPSETSASSGTKAEVATFLAGKITDCFQEHSYGLDPKSGLCGRFLIESNGTVAEADITKRLNCNKIPNNDCPGCDGCVASDGSGGDKLLLSITREKTYVAVEYLAGERRVEVREFGCFSEADCDDSDQCTTDVCMYPGTIDSACRHEYSCSSETTELGSCESDSDCFPAECCHPSSCTTEGGVPPCDAVACTLECRPGTMDCGQGSCACIQGKCAASIGK